MSDETTAKPETPRDRLILLHEEMCKGARTLMRRKNVSYADESDVFRNFLLFGRKYGARGILFRLGDKLSRLSTFVERLERGKDIEDGDGESVEDACRDGLNYFVLLYAFLKEEGVIK